MQETEKRLTGAMRLPVIDLDSSITVEAIHHGWLVFLDGTDELGERFFVPEEEGVIGVAELITMYLGARAKVLPGEVESVGSVETDRQKDVDRQTEGT